MCIYGIGFMWAENIQTIESSDLFIDETNFLMELIGW